METEIAKYIVSLGRIPVAWEEALFNTGVVSHFVILHCQLCPQIYKFTYIIFVGFYFRIL